MKLLLCAVAAATILSSCSNAAPKEEMKSTEVKIERSELQKTYEEIKKTYDILSPKVIRPAEGYLKYPYLIPAGFYSQMWDWDGFFMGNYFVSQGKPEYLKYWALNLIHGIDEKGYVSGCATTTGPRPIFGDFSMKPFLAQGMLISAQALNDFKWVDEHYEELARSITYREQTQRDSLTGLYYWQIAMQSGADNNVALNYFKDDTRSYLAADASTLQAREYEAIAIIAETLGKKEDAVKYHAEAQKVKDAINKYLWCEEDQTYYNVDRETRTFYKRQTYSNFLPLLDKIASEKNGKAMIERYLINEDEMKGKYGFRTLSLQDPDYNNKNIIVPFSNWQGPMWPIANYIYSIGLKNYGFDNEIEWMAQTVGSLIVDDFKKYDSLHESYHADTGAPLAPSDDHVDKDGKFVGFISWNLCIENVFEGILENKWSLLELKKK